MLFSNSQKAMDFERVEKTSCIIICQLWKSRINGTAIIWSGLELHVFFISRGKREIS